MTRLVERPGEVIHRDRKLSFTWNGTTMRGYEGDTIASALADNGVRVLSRSLKYRQPRGLMTVDYWDPGTLVQVGPEPNVRAGHRLLADGMEVTAQTGWPSPRTRPRIGQPNPHPVPELGLLLQDLHATALPLAGLRIGPHEVRQWWTSATGGGATAIRSSLCASRCSDRRRRTGRNDGGDRGGGRGIDSHARRTRAPAGWSSQMGPTPRTSRCCLRSKRR